MHYGKNILHICIKHIHLIFFVLRMRRPTTRFPRPKAVISRYEFPTSPPVQYIRKFLDTQLGVPEFQFNLFLRTLIRGRMHLPFQKFFLKSYVCFNTQRSHPDVMLVSQSVSHWTIYVHLRGLYLSYTLIPFLQGHAEMRGTCLTYF